MTTLLERPDLTNPVDHERRSIFFEQSRQLRAHYRVQLAMRDKLIGGIPRDPKLIEGWLRKKLALPGDQEDELRRAFQRTLVELGHDLTDVSTLENLGDAAEKVAGERNTVGFYRNERGPYIERRAIEAMLNGPLAA